MKNEYPGNYNNAYYVYYKTAVLFATNITVLPKYIFFEQANCAGKRWLSVKILAHVN